MWDFLRFFGHGGWPVEPHWWDPIALAAVVALLHKSRGGTPIAASICVYLACAIIAGGGAINYFLEKRRDCYPLRIVKILMYLASSFFIMLSYRFDRSGVYMFFFGLTLALFMLPLLLVTIVIHNDEKK